MRMVAMRVENTVIMMEIMMVMAMVVMVVMMVVMMMMMTVWQKRRLAARRFEIVQSRSWRSPARRLYIIVNPLFIIVFPIYNFDIIVINLLVCHKEGVYGEAF